MGAHSGTGLRGSLRLLRVRGGIVVGKVSTAAIRAAQRAVRPAQIALAWLLRRPAVTAPIVGATKLHHVDDAVAAVGRLCKRMRSAGWRIHTGHIRCWVTSDDKLACASVGASRPALEPPDAEWRCGRARRDGP